MYFLSAMGILSALNSLVLQDQKCSQDLKSSACLSQPLPIFLRKIATSVISSLGSGIIGGLLIGTACSLSFGGAGRILGISGILTNTLTEPDFSWRIIFILGLVCGSSFAHGFLPCVFCPTFPVLPTPFLLNIVAGFIVGFGTQLSNGCTSGHGICGISRLSLRSLVAVLTFMSTGIATTSFIQLTNILPNYFNSPMSTSFPSIFISFFTIIFFIVFLLLLKFFYVKQLHSEEENVEKDSKIIYIIEFFSGILFGMGLSISGMMYPKKVFSFLNLSTLFSNQKRLFPWDPTLLFVLGSALLVALPCFQFSLRILKKPIFSKEFILPKNNSIDLTLIVGSSLFGIGWGLCGLCPGNVIVDSGSGGFQLNFLLFFVFMGLGMVVVHQLRQRNIISRHSSKISA